ncbi:MAG: sugar ABC transporter permease [Thermotogae bacterium]|jgi:multiple sugar transport system permease protein|nr:sugar ABC transporter permease [Thermotogota bacterium]
MKNKQIMYVLLFISPLLIGISIFTIYPLIYGINLSFYASRGMLPPKFVGFQNYIELFQRGLTATVFYNGIYFAILAIPVGLILGLGLALLLDNSFKMNGIFRTAIYLPSVVPGVAMIMIFMLLFSPSSGIIDMVTRFLGIGSPGWINDPNLAKITYVIWAQWGVGGSTLIFLGGLQNIPRSYYEAARIDGAGAIRRFFSITLPLLSPSIFLNLLFATIGDLQLFMQAYIAPGPGNSTLTPVLDIYNHAFNYFQFGFASAESVMLFLLILAISAIIWITQKWWVVYEQ